MVAVATPNSTTVSNAGRVGTKTLTSSTTSTQLDNNNHHHHTIIVPSDSKNSSDDNDVLFDRKIEIASEGLISCYYRCFYKMPLKNALTLAAYVISMKSEINLSNNYRREVIQKLSRLSIYHGKTLLKDMTREQILDFLDHLRKPEASDPLHKWIGTYNIYRIT
jgi:hypothetical protein